MNTVKERAKSRACKRRLEGRKRRKEEKGRMQRRGMPGGVTQERDEEAPFLSLCPLQPDGAVGEC